MRKVIVAEQIPMKWRHMAYLGAPVADSSLEDNAEKIGNNGIGATLSDSSRADFFADGTQAEPVHSIGSCFEMSEVPVAMIAGTAPTSFLRKKKMHHACPGQASCRLPERSSLGSLRRYMSHKEKDGPPKEMPCKAS